MGKKKKIEIDEEELDDELLDDDELMEREVERVADALDFAKKFDGKIIDLKKYDSDIFEDLDDHIHFRELELEDGSLIIIVFDKNLYHSSSDPEACQIYSFLVKPWDLIFFFNSLNNKRDILPI